MKVLVTGGAGYVGSHTVLVLLEQGFEVTVFDNLSTGHAKAVPSDANLIVGDIKDGILLDKVLAGGPWEAVIHFASLSQVEESMRNPFQYMLENGISGISLIQACVRHGIKKFVLSSTAALFGNTNHFINEESSIDPGSPYGESKYFLERTLTWADRVFDLKSACLRYFNAAGCDSLGRAGEDHSPETHLIPLTIDAALERRETLTLFGTDYPTPDGTCVRDYIHVTDLANAHIVVLKQLEKHSVTYNIGTRHGYSNLEVIKTVEKVMGVKIPYIIGPRRIGDPSYLVADSTLLQKETGWRPTFTNLEAIIETACYWRKNNPTGYR